MSKKYNEIMDQVRVTDEMKQRVLQNVKEGIETEKYQNPERLFTAASCPMAGLPGIFPLQPVS